MQIQPNEMIELLKMAGINRPEEPCSPDPEELDMTPMPEPVDTMPDDEQMVLGDVKEDEDMQNGYDEHHVMDQDAYGDDNPESTINDKDENPIEVSEDTGPTAKQIHESLVYKYREFKK
jgi:hypothetical protein